MSRTTSSARLGRRAVVGLTAALALAACGSSSDPLATSPSTAGSTSAGGQIVVGGANFSESTLLAEIYAGALRAKGVDATTKTNIGSREIYLKALQDGSIQVFPEYTGALAKFYAKDYAGTDPTEVYAKVKEVIPSTLTVLAPSAAEDNDAMVVSAATAQKYKLTKVGDLAAVAKDLVLTAPPEFKTRPQGIPGLASTYGVTFGSFVPLTGQGIVQALKNDQAQVANIFSTDPAIATNGFVLLEDDKKLFGSQNVVPLVAKDRASQVSAALDAVSAKLTTAVLTDLLKKTDIDKRPHAEVAKEWLASIGLS
jgi:osmoprotectant transport system substrate-binding protein